MNKKYIWALALCAHSLFGEVSNQDDNDVATGKFGWMRHWGGLPKHMSEAMRKVRSKVGIAQLKEETAKFLKKRGMWKMASLGWLKPNHPVWTFISPAYFKLMSGINDALMQYNSYYDLKDLLSVRLNFTILKAAARNLPYATQSMANIYNAYAGTISQKFRESLTNIAEAVLEHMEAKSNLDSQWSLYHIRAALDEAGTFDGKIAMLAHYRPAKRKFMIVDSIHRKLIVSDDNYFTATAYNVVWKVLPTHYDSMIARLFELTDKSDRDTEAARDLCSIAFYLEILQGVISNRHSDTYSETFTFLSDAFVEFNASLKRLVQRFMTGNEQSNYLSLINLSEDMNVIYAIITAERDM